MSAIGQAAGAVFTAAAVAVALWLSRRDLWIRESDHGMQRWAQARLVRVSRPSLAIADESADQSATRLEFVLTNYGDLPILHVQAEAWTESFCVDGDRAPDAAATEEIILPGVEYKVVVVLNSGRMFDVVAWRVHWTDPHNERWFVDSGSQDARPYSRAKEKPPEDLIDLHADGPGVDTLLDENAEQPPWVLPNLHDFKRRV